MRTCRTPMSRYWAPSRWAGSGRLAGEIRSSEVESPMCATDWQEVRGPGAVFAAGRGAADARDPAPEPEPDPDRDPAPAPAWPDPAAPNLADPELPRSAVT